MKCGIVSCVYKTQEFYNTTTAGNWQEKNEQRAQLECPAQEDPGLVRWSQASWSRGTCRGLYSLRWVLGTFQSSIEVAFCLKLFTQGYQLHSEIVIPCGTVYWWLTNSHSALLSNCTFDLHSLLWMTWSAHLSLLCTLCVTVLPYSTCAWEHFGCHGTDGTLHSLLCSSDNLDFGASRGLSRYSWNCRFQWQWQTFLMKAHPFLLRHSVFEKIEQPWCILLS